MLTAQEMAVKRANRPQGISPGKLAAAPMAANAAERTASSAASTSAPQTSLAPYSRPGAARVSSSFSVVPLCSSSQFRLAMTATLTGRKMASMRDRL